MPWGAKASKTRSPTRMAQLGIGHAPVQAQGGYEDDVVHPGGGGQVEHRLDHALAVVRPAHGRQGQGKVVEGDGQAHAGAQQLGQRGAVAQRLGEGVRGWRRRGRPAGPAVRGRRRPGCVRRASVPAGSPRRAR